MDVRQPQVLRRRRPSAVTCTAAAATLVGLRRAAQDISAFAGPQLSPTIGVGHEVRSHDLAAAADSYLAAMPSCGYRRNTTGSFGTAPCASFCVTGTALAGMLISRKYGRPRLNGTVASAGKDGFGYMPVVPEGGVPEEEKTEVPRTIYEGTEEVKLEGPRPSGMVEGEHPYFWKMTKDKRQIEVVVPLDDHVRSQDIIFRLGDDAMDVRRGPTLEVGYRKKDNTGKLHEVLVIDGRILNAVNRDDCFWTVEDIGGVNAILLTLTRPTMMRRRHDPILRRATEEERIEPQTWDALTVEEREKPDVTEKVFMDISLDDEPAGRLEFGLYGNKVPKTVKNFVGMITGEYKDENGETKTSAHCLKKTGFTQVLSEFLIKAGNPGLDHVIVNFSVDELKEYLTFFENFKMKPKKVGPVERDWAIRWGADLGLPDDEEGRRQKEGAAVDGNDEEELEKIVQRLKALDEKGEGAKLIFFRPEWEQGVDIYGGTFNAENFSIPHAKRGMLSMDRSEDKDRQGSIFFILLKEFPEMDKRWVAFGEMLSGFEVLDKIEEDCDGHPEKLKIEDCGILA